jgi:hypothetical protein
MTTDLSAAPAHLNGRLNGMDARRFALGECVAQSGVDLMYQEVQWRQPGGNLSACPGPPGAATHPQLCIANRFCVAVFYECGRRLEFLAAVLGGSWPGQWRGGRSSSRSSCGSRSFTDIASSEPFDIEDCWVVKFYYTKSCDCEPDIAVTMRNAWRHAADSNA